MEISNSNLFNLLVSQQQASSSSPYLEPVLLAERAVEQSKEDLQVQLAQAVTSAQESSSTAGFGQEGNTGINFDAYV